MNTRKRQLVLATRNKGKIREFQRLLERYSFNDRLEIEILGLTHFPDMPDVEESGDSFEANSLLKSRAIAAFTKLPALADDSGLCVDALGGDPGIYSARWAGAHGDDLGNTEKVLAQLAELEQSKGERVDRTARFVCVVSLVIPPEHPQGPREICAQGVMEGEIIDAPRGTNGFGYDPIFKPSGFELTSGELEPSIKDEISHRAQALGKIIPAIDEFL